MRLSQATRNRIAALLARCERSFIPDRHPILGDVVGPTDLAKAVFGYLESRLGFRAEEHSIYELRDLAAAEVDDDALLLAVSTTAVLCDKVIGQVHLTLLPDQLLAQTNAILLEASYPLRVTLDGTLPSNQSVPQLALGCTSAIVEKALADAEQLIRSRGSLSAVDRLHTAFHGHLRDACAKAQIPVADDATLTVLFKALRKDHPRFRHLGGARGSEVDHIGRSMAAILDALNPIRNQNSLAHPNQFVLDEAEATLVVNTMRTLLRYVDQKLGDTA